MAGARFRASDFLQAHWSLIPAAYSRVPTPVFLHCRQVRPDGQGRPRGDALYMCLALFSA